MSKGKIKEYNQERGFGAIIDLETGQEFAVYANYLLLKAGEVLKKGQEVEYEIENQRNEKWAVNVRVLLGK